MDPSLLANLPLIGQAEAPAAGAALDQVLIASSFAIVGTIVLAVLCIGHRSGRIKLLSWAGRLSERVSPLPAWAAVPAFLALVTLLPTLFGLQWDEALHISKGRDEGPLANPSHYLLLQGIFAGFAAGVIAIAMADSRVPRSGVLLGRDWRAPAGGLITALGSGVALIGFPLDDVWHRFFGQDVTLWGPTHVMMIAGMSVSVIGIMILIVEGLRAAGAKTGGFGEGSVFARGGSPVQRGAQLALATMTPAGLLLVVSLLQGEWDYGVPQYRLLLHPMIVMAAGATALVAARIFFGRGAAIAAVIGFVVVRGLITLLVGPTLDLPFHVFPVYLVEALIVELVALRLGDRRPLAVGVWAGVLIGTVGLAAEWAWSQLFAHPWNAALLPEAIPLALGMALAGGVIGAWLGAHLMVADAIRTSALRWSAVAAAVFVTGAIAYGLQEGGGEEIRGSVTLTEVSSGSERTVDATVRIDPPSAAENVEWLNQIAWQGGGLISRPLEPIGEGLYQTVEPLPVHGSWKSMLRLQTGDRLLGLPVYLPDDPAIPVEGVAAPARFERQFVGEKAWLQREAKDVGAGLFFVGTLIVAALSFALLGLVAAALHRLSVTSPVTAVPAGPQQQEQPDGTAPRQGSPLEQAPAPA